MNNYECYGLKCEPGCKSTTSVAHVGRPLLAIDPPPPSLPLRTPASAFTEEIAHVYMYTFAGLPPYLCMLDTLSPSKVFTKASIGKTKAKSYPSMDSNTKAAYVKPIITWLTHKTRELFETLNFSDGSHLVDVMALREANHHSEARELLQSKRNKLGMTSTCAWALAPFHWVMDTNTQFLSESAAQDAQSAGNIFLSTWSKLARDALDEGVPNFRIRPKHHYFQHLVLGLGSCENLRYLFCFADEDFMGRVTRLARKSHRAVCIERTLQKYVLLLFRRWRRVQP